MGTIRNNLGTIVLAVNQYVKPQNGRLFHCSKKKVCPLNLKSGLTGRSGKSCG